MNDPKSNEIIAIEIVQSWKNESSNHILVAPPLTNPENIFKKLKNRDFLTDNELDYDKLNIASPSSFNYRDPNRFIKKIIKDWKISSSFSDDNDYLEILGEAVESIFNDGNTPIILLPNFHKIIQSLSWELGALLRDLEHRYNLRTVVQLPIPLTKLRERWEMLEGKEAFISSDFGQGHSSLVLTGYTEEEVNKIGKNYGLDHKLIQEVINLAGALPNLVSLLCGEAKIKNTPHALKNYARQHAQEQCQRFIDWLDAPEESSYREAIANIQTGIASQEDIITVKSHDWNKLLINKSDMLKSEMIGYACIDHGSVGQYRKYMMIITETIKKGDYVNALRRCDNLPKQFLSNKVLLTIDLINILKSIATLTPRWADSEKNCSLALKKLNKINYKRLDDLKKDLNTVKKISQQMKSCLKVSEKSDWRITDCLCGREQFKDIGQISVAIVWQKLYEAQKISDYTAAMSGILSLPEQILQIYCSLKLDINVWDAPEYDNNIKEEVNKLWSKNDFKFPSKGSRLAFNHLLYIGMAKMNLILNENERLFLELDEIVKLSEIYGKERGESAHSITIVNKREWEEYYNLCYRLLNKLSIILFNKNVEATLPSLDQYIYELIGDTSDINEA